LVLKKLIGDKTPFTLREVFQYSFKEALKSRAVKILGISGILALIAFIKTIKEALAVQNYRDACLIVLLFLLIYYCLIFSYFVLFHFYPRFTQYSKSVSSYGLMNLEIKQAFSVVYKLKSSSDFVDLYFQNKQPDLGYEEAVKATLIFVCKKVSNAFNLVNSAKCNVSIKLPVKGRLDASACVYNICRSEDRCNRDVSSYMAAQHTVIGNSPFQRIIANYMHNNFNKLYYVNNRIKKSDYQSTSIGTYASSLEDLPYESELVVPITPFYSFQQNNKPHLLGFICIDCDRVDGFNEKYDPEILQGISESICDVVESLHMFHLNAEKNVNQTEKVDS
jgi:hypothetical protein